MRLIASLLIGFIAVVCLASDSVPRVIVKNEQIKLSIFGPLKDGRRRVRSWSEAVGERAVAEGLAWGVREKGLGQRVILDYGHIYVDGPELPEGKLVRVVGTLQRGRMKAAPPGAQGYAEPFDYFYLKAEKITPIDVVRAPMLVEPTEER